MKMLYERPSAEVINLQALENIAVIHDADEQAMPYSNPTMKPVGGSVMIGGRD